MPRKMYETASDQQNEANAKKIVQSLVAPGVVVHKLPRRYYLDWYFEINEARCVQVAEYKRRGVVWQGEGHELMIALDKIMHGLELGRVMQVPFFLYIDFKNGLRKAEIRGPIQPMQVRWGGRIFSPRDSEDQEPCVFLPQELFREVV